MRYKIAMFDWNGTLADDPRICHECVVEIFRIFGSHLPLPTFEEWRTERGNHNFLDFYYDRGISRSITIDHMRDIWSTHYEKRVQERGTIVRDGAAELLKFCQDNGAINIIVSSSIDDVDAHLQNAGVRHLLHLLYLRVPDKREKMEILLKDLAIDPGEAFYVDDSFDGVMHAKQVGVDTFGLTTGCKKAEQIEAAGPSHLVGSLQEVLEIIRRD